MSRAAIVLAVLVLLVAASRPQIATIFLGVAMLASSLLYHFELKKRHE